MENKLEKYIVELIRMLKTLNVGEKIVIERKTRELLTYVKSEVNSLSHSDLHNSDFAIVNTQELEDMMGGRNEE